MNDHLNMGIAVVSADACLDAFTEERVDRVDAIAGANHLGRQVGHAAREFKRLVRYATGILGKQYWGSTEQGPSPEDRGDRMSAGTVALASTLKSQKLARQYRYAAKALKLDLNLIRSEYPERIAHPCVRALMNAAQAGLVRMQDFLSHEARNATKREIARHRRDCALGVLAQTLAASRTDEYREECTRIRHAAWQRMDSTRGVIDYLFTQRSRLLCVRVDLRYRHFFDGVRYDGALLGHPSWPEVRWHREYLIHLMRRKLFKDCFFGYIVREEWGPSTGFHLHLMVLLDGRVRRDGVKIGNLIGKVWREDVTDQQGYAFNCNLQAAMGRYRVRGTGMFEKRDTQGLKGLMKAAEYLCKADFYGSFYRQQGRRSYFRSLIGSHPCN